MHRRPATDEDLAKIPVSPEEEASFSRNMNKLIDRVATLVGTEPIVGIALMRAGAQGASLVGVPHGDMIRLIHYALTTFPARSTRVVIPTEAEIEQVFPMVRHVLHVSAAALRGVHTADVIGMQFYAGVSFLRYHGLPDELVLQLAQVSLDDADDATASYAQKKSKGTA